MPIWQVSHTDGCYQVADAENATYPLTMDGAPITRFNEGWTPRGLQTGAPPLHVLELEHTSGVSAVWLLDETLSYRGNSVEALVPEEQTRLLEVMGPVVQSIHEEAVVAPHAAIPAAAHRFEGMLPATVAALLWHPVHQLLPRAEIVDPDNLGDLGGSYTSNGHTLPVAWISQALQVQPDQAQEHISLPDGTAARHLDPVNGLAYYLLPAEGGPEAVLFMPAANLIVSRHSAPPDPMLPLIVHYATDTNRAVSLPEAAELTHEPPPDLLPASEPAPRTTYDAPVLETLPELEIEPSAEPVAEPAIEPEAEPQAVPHAAPIEATPEPVEAAIAPEAPVPVAQAVPPEAGSAPLPAPTPAPPPPPPPPPANWWQRLLGLGNG